MFRWLTERRRRHILDHPWPDSWDAIIDANVPMAAQLDDDERARLRQLAQVFIAEKHWEGCGGLALTDEMKVTIAAQGCLLILARDHDLFARLVTILVYPSTVVSPPRAPRVWRSPYNIHELGGTPVLGESSGDAVILAWDDVVRSARDPHDGRNLVLHELAHAIDFADGRADGTPPLESDAQRRTWAAVCTAAFRALEHAAPAGDDPARALRAYGATNEAEFFAVATEAFFERPHDLRAQESTLYALLRDFYRIDLAR